MNRAERRAMKRELLRAVELERQASDCDCVPRLLEVVESFDCSACGFPGARAGELMMLHCPPETRPGLGQITAACPSCASFTEANVMFVG